MNDEANELKLYIVNDGDLHRQQGEPILKNLATKKARGIYKHDLAVKLYGYLVEAGAKKYAREFDDASRWHKLFDVPTRKKVAEELTKSFETEYKLGNYDHLLPKKYQKPSKTAHATKKSTKWRTPEGISVQWGPVNNAWLALWPGRGAIKDQQVLKIGGTEDMHEWLRSTYGNQYGLATRATKAAHATKKHTFEPGALKGHFCAVCGRERDDGSGEHYISAMPNMPKKSGAQLDREINQFIARGRR